MKETFYSVIINHNVELSKIDSCWESLEDATKRKMYLEDTYKITREDLYRNVEVHQSTVMRGNQ